MWEGWSLPLRIRSTAGACEGASQHHSSTPAQPFPALPQDPAAWAPREPSPSATALSGEWLMGMGPHPATPVRSICKCHGEKRTRVLTLPPQCLEASDSAVSLALAFAVRGVKQAPSLPRRCAADPPRRSEGPVCRGRITHAPAVSILL
ncbi:hypothetical protein DR999_PMT13549 [Platysternon megacephalum]|uniref:Uncharacterized protein n=1 Tax=Platysternon megacephalum TaxID=55544 RepID=A0A4D9E372_9SAUR|nr:hypothetical protein DR999_PMT13549 [Platysternon megacephalum]